MRHARYAVCLPLLLLTGCIEQHGTRLLKAAEAGDTATLEALLARGADPNQENDGGFTALILAARAGSVPAIQALLGHGADPNLRGGVNDWTPVMHAIHKNQQAAVAVLLDGGAGVNARSKHGVTALMMAAGYGDTPIVELLLDHGADPRAQAADGATAFAAAVGGVPDVDRFTLGSCQTSTVQALLRKDPRLRLPDNFWGRTARLAAMAAKLRGCAY